MYPSGFTDPTTEPASLTLLAAAGYRESHQVLTMLRLALNLEGEALELQTRDIHDLYEIWSFLEIVRSSPRLPQPISIPPRSSITTATDYASGCEPGR